jgi:hypothetical protein
MLWVDAICINQDDLAERGHQVQLMRKIYSNAMQVVIGLRGSEGTSSYLGSMERNNFNLDNKREARFLKALEASWFERVWVIQEVVFAKRAFVLSEFAQFDWDELINYAFRLYERPWLTSSQRLRCNAILSIQHLRYLIQNKAPENVYGQFQERTSEYSEFRFVSQPLQDAGCELILECSRFLEMIPFETTAKITHPPQGLLDLLELFRPCLATDGRDKIYALLGLASAFETDDFASAIEPDYGRDSESIFADFARHVLSQSKSLRILQNVDWQKQRATSLPSWVPDWSSPLKRQPLGWLCGPQYSLRTQATVVLDFLDDNLLSIGAVHIDKIEAIGDVFIDTPDVRVWTSWISLGLKYRTTPPELFAWGAFKVPQVPHNYQEAYWGSYPRTTIPEHCVVICSGRRYIVTEQHRAGLCPVGAEVGDGIVLIPGTKFPFVVRKDESDNMFYIVGECYLDGVSLNSLMEENQHDSRVYCFK